jgi:hypothetical protein
MQVWSRLASVPVIFRPTFTLARAVVNLARKELLSDSCFALFGRVIGHTTRSRCVRERGVPRAVDSRRGQDLHPGHEASTLRGVECGIDASAKWDWLWYGKDVALPPSADGALRNKLLWLCPDCAADIGSSEDCDAFLERLIAGEADK